MGFFRKLFGSDPTGTITREFREPHTGDRYRMKFVPTGNQLAIYALDFPADPHGKGVTVNHKYPDGRICVTSGVDVPTLSKAKAIAIHWMTGWSVYVRSRDARWPRNGRVRVNVAD